MKISCLHLLTALCIALCAGCGDGRMNVKGRIMKGGSAFIVPDDDFVRVTFIPIMADRKRASTCYIAEYNNQDGTFKALGADLGGVPRGKYRITVAHERKRRDLFKGAYDIDKSPFVFEINSGAQEIVIDLDKPRS